MAGFTAAHSLCVPRGFSAGSRAAGGDCTVSGSGHTSHPAETGQAASTHQLNHPADPWAGLSPGRIQRLRSAAQWNPSRLAFPSRKFPRRQDLCCLDMP